MGIATIVALNHIPLPLTDWLSPDCDIFHASNLLRKPPQRSLLTATIHDTTGWILPETHKPGNVTNEMRFAREVLSRADGLIAVSRNTKEDAVRFLGLEAARIRVIHPGIASTYFGVTPGEINAARVSLGLAGRYCLFVGTIEPRKNIERLLDAWAAISPAVLKQYELVVVGMPGWRSEGTLRRLQSLDGGSRARYLGYVPERLMPGLVAGATAALFPSLYEGFGFPVAQAMAAGTAILTSNCSSMPEVANGCALLVDPCDVEQISHGIERLLLDEEYRDALAVKGKEQAEYLRWERCALESWEFFEDVSAHRRLDR